jgi:hypothetical protein
VTVAMRVRIWTRKETDFVAATNEDRAFQRRLLLREKSR